MAIERQPYDNKSNALSFTTQASTVYVSDTKTLTLYLQELEDQLSLIKNNTGEGGNSSSIGVSNIEFNYKYISVSDLLNKLSVIKGILPEYWKSNILELSINSATPHVWKKIIITFVDSEGLKTNNPEEFQYCGSLGKPGESGEFLAWIFTIKSPNDGRNLSNEISSSFTYPNYNNDDFTPNNWTRSILPLTSPHDVLWCSTRLKKNNKWEAFGEPFIFNVYPKENLTLKNIYTNSPNYDLNNWNSEKIVLMNKLFYDVDTYEVKNIVGTTYDWYTDVPNYDNIIYSATCYFNGSKCIAIDAPIRITGEQGVGSDGSGVEFAYCIASSINAYENGEIYKVPGTPEHFAGGSNWKDNANQAIINSTEKYQFISQRFGHYTDLDNWFWEYEGKKYGFGDDPNILPITEAPSDWNYGWSEPRVWSSWGVDGIDGDGIQYTYLKLTEAEYKILQDSPTNWNFKEIITEEETLLLENYPITLFKESFDPEHIYISLDAYTNTNSENINYYELLWTDNPSGVDLEHPYEMVCIRLYTYKNISENGTPIGTEKAWKPWDVTNIALWSHYGKNAAPQLVVLLNPFESFYYLQEYGQNKENFVIIDLDLISSGELVYYGGDSTLEIDSICLIDYNNLEKTFDDSNLCTLALNENLKVKCKLTYNSGNPIISIIGISNTNDFLEVESSELPEGINISDGDFCFKCTLDNYLLRIPIRAYSPLKKHVSLTTWVISAIKDRNHDNSIVRYSISPSLNRIVKTSYTSEKGTKISYNTNENIKFILKTDSFGKISEELTGDNFRIRLKDPIKENTWSYYYSNEILLEDIKTLLETIIDEESTPKITSTKVELQVIDSDYDQNYETNLSLYEKLKNGETILDSEKENLFVTVDSCTIYLEYFPEEAVTDEQILQAINLVTCSNESIVVIPELEYLFEFKNVLNSPVNLLLDIVSIPKNLFEKIKFDDDFISLESIEESTKSISKFTLKAKKDIDLDPTSGSIIYNLGDKIHYTWIGDRNNDYTYYNYEMNPSTTVIGYDEEKTFNVEEITITCTSIAYSKGTQLFTYGKGVVILGEPSSSNYNYAYLNDLGQTTITLGLNIPGINDGHSKLYWNGTDSFTLHWFTPDDDYTGVTGVDLIIHNPNTSEREVFYEVDTCSINLVPTKIIAGQINNLVGQSSRIRNKANFAPDETYYFYAVGEFLNADNGDSDNIIEIVEGDSVKYIPKYYDIISEFVPAHKNTEGDTEEIIPEHTTYYKCKEPYNCKGFELNLLDTTYWDSTDMEDFMAIDTLIADRINAKSVKAEKLLISNTKDSTDYVAGMINGYDEENVEKSDIRIFAGTSKEKNINIVNAPFRVTDKGLLHAEEADIIGDLKATSFKVKTLQQSENTSTTINEMDDSSMWITTYGKAKEFIKKVKNLENVLVEGASVELSDNMPIFLIKLEGEGGPNFFVLNPLGFTNGETYATDYRKIEEYLYPTVIEENDFGKVSYSGDKKIPIFILLLGGNTDYQTTKDKILFNNNKYYLNDTTKLFTGFALLKSSPSVGFSINFLQQPLKFDEYYNFIIDSESIPFMTEVILKDIAYIDLGELKDLIRFTIANPIVKVSENEEFPSYIPYRDYIKFNGNTYYQLSMYSYFYTGISEFFTSAPIFSFDNNFKNGFLTEEERAAVFLPIFENGELYGGSYSIIDASKNLYIGFNSQTKIVEAVTKGDSNKTFNFLNYSWNLYEDYS